MYKAIAFGTKAIAFSVSILSTRLKEMLSGISFSYLKKEPAVFSAI